MTRFITNAGHPVILRDMSTGEEIDIGQYGVWDDAGRRKLEVIATGNDLDKLQAEYGPDLPVFDLPGFTEPKNP